MKSLPYFQNMRRGALRPFVLAASAAACIAACNGDGSAPELPRRMSPMHVTTADAESDAWALFDRDTETRFDPGDISTVSVDLADSERFSQIKTFGTSHHLLTVLGANGEQVAGPFDLASGFVDGWNRFDLGGAEVEDVSLRFEAVGEPGPVGDVELWGVGTPLPLEYAPGADADAETDRALPANIVVSPSAQGPVVLTPAAEKVSSMSATCAAIPIEIERHPGTYRRMFLRYSTVGAFRPFVLTRALNGGPMTRGHWVEPREGTAGAHVYPIDPEQLHLGKNEAHFCLPHDARSPVTISDVELIGELDHGSNLVQSATVAPKGEAPTRGALGLLADEPEEVALESGEELVLAFDRSIELDGFAMATAPGDGEPTGRCVFTDGGVAPLDWEPDETGSEIEGTWNVYRVAPGGPACAGVRVSSNAGMTVRAIRAFGSGAAQRVDFPQLTVASPLEHFGHQAWIEGWARASAGDDGVVSVAVDGQPAGGDHGAFGRMITRTSDPESAWVVTLEAKFRDGSTLTRQVVLEHNAGALPGTDGLEGVVDDGLTEAQRRARYGAEGDQAAQTLGRGDAGHVELGTHVAVDVPAGALKQPATISITHLGFADLPPLDPGMVNVTAPFAHGYEFLPHGQQFEEAVSITLPYQPSLIPPGYSAHDVETWFFNEELKRWERLARDAVDAQGGVVRSLSDHFTVMINAIVVTPEHPQAASFDGNRIKGLEAAHPGAGLTLIEPPTANSRGDASLMYPLRVPPGRRGAEPQLALQYNSGAANGWLGVGWDLPISTISVDTRFGVPRYSQGESFEGKETETYLLDGEQLSPTAHRGEFVGRYPSPAVFHRRVEGSFERIVRYGDNPKKFYWVVTAKDGTKRWYGRADGDRGGDLPAAIGSDAGVFRWYLRAVEDTFGNRVRYDYDEVVERGVNTKRTLVPSAIHYTLARGEGGDGTYQVHFCRSDSRPDPILSARGGFLELTSTLLERVEVHYGNPQGGACSGPQSGSIVRAWDLEYAEHDVFGKSRLVAIQQSGDRGVIFAAARHEFDYYDDVSGNGDLNGFGTPNTSQGAVTPPDVKPMATPVIGALGKMGRNDLDLPGNVRVTSTLLGGTRTFGANGGVYIGLNPFNPDKTLSGGVSMNMSFSQADGLAQLVDVDGDGLPDHLTCVHGDCQYNRNRGVIDGVIHFDDNAQPLDGLGSARKDRSFTFGVGPQINFGAQFFYNFAYTVSRTPRYLSDVNGDGLMDVVDGSNVRFGRFVGADLENANVAYTSSSGQTPAPLGGLGTATLEEDELQEIEQALRDMTPPEDALRLWRAPYDGTVDISGVVKLARSLEDQDDGVLAVIEVARAVDESVEQIFSQVLGPIDAEEGEEPPAPVTSADASAQVTLTAGDHIIFRVHAREDGLHDEVEWAPVIEYTTLDGGTDPTGLNQVKYDSKSEFVALGGGFTVGLPYSGRVRVTGGVAKLGAVADDVWLEVLENGEVVHRMRMAAKDTATFAIDYEHTVTVDPSDKELSDDEDADVDFTTSALSVRLASRVPVDLRQFAAQGDFDIVYLEATDEQDSIPVLDESGDPAITFSVPLDFRSLVPTDPIKAFLGPSVETEPLVPAEALTFEAPAPADGEEAAAEANVTLAYSFLPDGLELEDDEDPLHEFWLTAVQEGEVVASKRVSVEAVWESAQVTWSLPVDVPTTFAVSATRPGDWKAVLLSSLQYSVGASGYEDLPYDVYAVAPATPYSAPFRGWRSGSVRPGPSGAALNWLAYFGSSSCVSEMKDVKRRKARKKARKQRKAMRDRGENDDPEQLADDSYDEDPPVADENETSAGGSCEDTDELNDSPEARRGPMRPISEGTGCPQDLVNALENAAGAPGELSEQTEDLPEELKCPELDPPHWRGRDDRVYLTARTMSASRIGPDRMPLERTGPIQVGGAGNDGAGRGVILLGATTSHSFGGGAFGASASLGRSKSKNRVDFRDLNGDGLPDLIRPGKAKFTTPIGGLDGYTTVLALDNRHRSRSTTGGFGYGGAPLGQKGSARAQEGGTAPGGGIGNSNNKGSQGSYNFSGSINAGVSRNEWDLMDVNGDGLPDRVKFDEDTSEMKVRVNLGYDFAEPESWGDHGIHRATNFEVNAGIGYTSSDQGWNIGIGGSMSRSQLQTADIEALPDRVKDKLNDNASLLDVNADGLLDSVRPAAEGLFVRLNTGTGFSTEELLWGGGNAVRGGVEISELDSLTVSANGGFTISVGPLVYGLLYVIISPGLGASVTESRTKVVIRDIDGDGAVDHLRSVDEETVSVALNNTRRTGLLKEVKQPLGSSMQLEYARAGNTRAMPHSRWVMAGLSVHDGVADALDPAAQADWRVRTFAYEGGRYDRAEREFLGFSSVTSTDLDTRGFAGGDPSSLAAYRSVEQQFHNATVFDKGLPRLTRVLDHTSGGATLEEQSYTYELRNGEGQKQADLTPDGFHEDPTQTPVLAADWLQVAPREERSRSYEASSSDPIETFTVQQVDGLGNVVSFLDAGSLHTDTDDFLAAIEYADCGAGVGSAYVVGVPQHISVRNVAGQLLRERTSEIDCRTGAPKWVDVTLNGEETAHTSLGYRSSGVLDFVETPSGGGSTYRLDYDYDDFIGAHVTEVRDSFDYVSTATYEPRRGLQERDVDINGQTVTTTYDAHGRIESITGPYEQSAGQATVTYGYKPEARPVPYATTANRDPLHPGDPIETVTFTDGLGRVLQTKKDGALHVGDDAPVRDVRIVSGRVQLDPWGRAVKTWYPTSEGLGSPATQFYSGKSPGEPTVMAHDARDRVRSTRLPDGSETSLVYSIQGAGFSAMRRLDVTDAEGKRRGVLRDGRDALREVQEFIGGARRSTKYDYNPMGELTLVTDAAGNRTVVRYDTGGRRTDIISPDSGHTQLVYDTAGNVKERVTAALRARNEQIRYEYDRTHLVKVDHPGSEPDIFYTWGEASAPDGQRGRIVKVSDAGGTVERQYGPLGEVITETRHLYRHNQRPSSDGSPRAPEGPRLITRFQYDTWNRLLSMTYPDGEVLRYSYDSGGLVSGATGTKLGVTYPYVNRLEYDEFGQRVFQEQGNGIRTHYAYDPQTRRLASLEAGEFQRMRYGYDRVGNVRSLVNDIADLPAHEKGGHVDQSFVYDDLHRLQRAEGTWKEPGGKINHYTLDLQYDAIHNIRHKTQHHEVGRNGKGKAVVQKKTTYDWGYTYAGDQPHAPSTVGPQSFTYDASGRQVIADQRGQHRVMVWDSEDRIRFIQEGGRGTPIVGEDGAIAGAVGQGKTTEFIYDAEGQRIVKSGAQGHTAYVNPHYTLRNETIATKHVFVGASRVVSKLVPGRAHHELPTETDDVAHWLGRWWQHRSETGWEHGQNIHKNPHYQVATQVPSPMGLPESNFIYFYHPDHLGSTSFVTDGDGEIYEHLQYFAHGEVWADERSNTERLPYLFTGKELDQETGLYDFGARQYDPRVGVWLSPDPMLPMYVERHNRGRPPTTKDWNLTLYAGANPLIYVDPTGLEYELGGSAEDIARLQEGLQALSNNQIMVDEYGVVHEGPQVYDDPGRAASTALISRGIASDKRVRIEVDRSRDGGEATTFDAVAASDGTGSNALVTWNPDGPDLVDAEGGFLADTRRDLFEELVHADRMQRGVHILTDFGVSMYRRADGSAELSTAPAEELVTNGIPMISVTGRLRPEQLDQDITVNRWLTANGLPNRTAYH